MNIKFFHIKNFRSLKNVSIDQIATVAFFYGQNNSGKSNILAAIDAIFRSKVMVDPVTSSGGNREGASKSNFHEGRIENFAHNYYFGTNTPISFEIGLGFEDSELAPFKSVFDQIVPTNVKGVGKRARLNIGDGRPKILKISGRFEKIDATSSEAVPIEMIFNGKFQIYHIDSKKPVIIGNAPTSVALADRLSAFTGLCKLITDSFLLIGADRFISNETFALGNPHSPLAAKCLKRWLFDMSTTASDFDKFKEVEKYFSDQPFQFGNLSFTLDRASGELDIMVEQRGHRLPLERLGSGLQQVLYLVSQIVANKNKIIGIEELEINLSPESQKELAEMLKDLVFQKRLLHQVLVTSHSPYFRGRGDVGSYDVTYQNNLKATTVEKSKTRSFRTRFTLPI